MRVLNCVVTGQTIQLTQEIANSGEGTVWETSRPQVIAKLYHDPTPERIQKLQLMISHPPMDPMRDRNHVTFAWPQDILQDQSGVCVGFIMPMIGDSVKLSTIYNPRLRSRKAPRFNWRYLHTTALNIALATQSLHQEGYVIGDIKPQNILVNKNALVSIIDTDSFQVIDPYNHKVYRCLVGSEGFTPAELLGKELSDLNQTEVHDRFRIAVIFYLLLFGDHPFKGKWIAQGDSPLPTDLIRHGYWPYAKRSLIKPGPNTMSLNIVHPQLQQAFQLAFTQGHQSPNLRPTAQQWTAALKIAIQDLKSCSVQSNHVYSRTQPHCPWCLRQTQLGVDIFNPNLKNTLTQTHQKKLDLKRPSKRFQNGGVTTSQKFSTAFPPRSQSSRSFFAYQPPQIGGSFAILKQNLAKLPPTFVGSMLCLSSLFGLGLLLLPEIRYESLGKIPDYLQSSLSNWYGQQAQQPQDSKPLKQASRDPSNFTLAHADSITGLNVSPDGRYLVSGSRDTSVKLWDLNTGKLLKTLSDHYEPINLVRFTENGSIILGSGQSGNVVLWNFPQGTVLKRLNKSTETGGSLLRNATADPNGRYVISNGWRGGILIHNLLTNQLKRIETSTIASEQALLVTPRGNALVGSASSGQLTVWDINSGAVQRNFPSLVDWQPIEPIRSMTISRTGKLLASGNWSGTINLWDYQKGKIIQSLVGHGTYVSAMAISPNEQYLVTGGGDHLIKLWDLNSGTLIRSLRGHQNDITVLVFTPDSQRLVSGSDDHAIKVWNLTSGQGGDQAVSPLGANTESTSSR